MRVQRSITHEYQKINEMSTVSTLIILDISKIHIQIIKNHEAEFNLVCHSFHFSYFTYINNTFNLHSYCENI